MKNNIIPKLTLIALLMFSRAAVAQLPPAPAFKSISLVGVIRFRGEFEIVPSVVESSASAPKCYSGYVFPPTRELELSKLYDGRLVKVTGKLVRYSEIRNGNALSQASRYITNQCGGEFVIIADQIYLSKEE